MCAITIIVDTDQVTVKTKDRLYTIPSCDEEDMVRYLDTILQVELDRILPGNRAP